MNGHNSGAFRRALTDAVLEEYADAGTAPRESKRGVGNGYRRLRVSLLAALLLLSVFGVAVFAADGFRETRQHYAFQSEVSHIPASNIQMIYMPDWIPSGYVPYPDYLSIDPTYICSGWRDDQHNMIRFSQGLMNHAFFELPEEYGTISWNGFEIHVFQSVLKEWHYVWDDGTYTFCLRFHAGVSEEDRYRVFDSIAPRKESVEAAHVDVCRIDHSVSADGDGNVDIWLFALGRPRLDNTVVTVCLEKASENGDFVRYESSSDGRDKNEWVIPVAGRLVDLHLKTAITEPGEYRVVIRYLFTGAYRQQAVTQFEKLVIE